MKKITLFILSLILVSQFAFAQSNTKPTPKYRPVLVKTLPQNIFTPMGFDNNDNVQLVIAGEYPNTCYKVGPVQSYVDAANKRIIIRSESYFYRSSMCAQIMVPYFVTVNVGIVTAGIYSIYAEDANGNIRKFARMPIALSQNSGPDDLLYAQINHVFVTRSSSGQYVMNLEGQMTNSCMDFGQLKVLYRENNVVEVLPTVTMNNTSGCQDVMVPFVKSVPMDKIPNGKALIHVRSLSGQSVNTVVDFKQWNTN